MPLLAATSAPTPGPDPGGGWGEPEPQPLRITYTDPDGQAWDWSNPATGCVVTHVAGLGSPPAQLASTALPGGSVLPDAYTAGQRQIVIGLDVSADRQADLLSLLDRLHRALWTERYGLPAPATLTIGRPDGTARILNVLCTSGPEQTDADAARNGYTTSTDYALTFVTTIDALFNDLEPTRLVFQSAVADAGIPPLPPVRLRAGHGFDTQTVTNPGDVEAFPVWTCTGPGRPTLINHATGHSFGLSTLLTAGEVVTIDTRPARQQVYDAAGRDRWEELVKTSPRDLWALPAGDTQVTVRMDDAGPGSRIELAFTARWLRA